MDAQVVSEGRYGEYVDKFFEVNKPKEQGTYRSLFNKLESFDVFITEWDINNLEDFIKKSGSISVNTINKFLQFSKEIYKFVCEENSVKPKHLYLPKDLKFYIDMNALNDVTLTEMQYKLVKNLMLVETFGPHMTSKREKIDKGIYNYRDSVLWMLPWEAGLTNQEIKNLRVDDITPYEEYGKKKMKLKLKDRNVIITNKDLVEAIEKTIEQNVYFRIEKPTVNDGVVERQGREYFVYLKRSPALIRPVAMRQSENPFVANPSMLLGRVLARIADEHDVPGVKLEKISVEDIRRSKIIHMLKDEAYDVSDIREWTSRENESDLFAWRDIAEVFKRKEEELRNKK